MSFTSLIANVSSYPKYFRLFAIDNECVLLMPNPIAIIFIDFFLNVFIICLTAFGSVGSPSVNVKNIFGFFNNTKGFIFVYTSANGVPPLAIIFANLLTATLFHLVLNDLINQHIIDLSCVLNA